MAAPPGDSGKIQVRFVSRLEELEIPESAFAVPEGLTRKGLAEVVNGLLQLDPPQPFDFLINEEFLRSSLATFLSNRHVRRPLDPLPGTRARDVPTIIYALEAAASDSAQRGDNPHLD